jgi:PTH2 family peptidyl-tRNA hydrolase
MEEVKRISKQVIVVRKDLNMRKGKMVAQGSHASMKSLLDNGSFAPNEGGSDEFSLDMPRDSALSDWLFGKFTKICVSVNSESELLEVYNKAKEKGLMCSLITDAGLTEFSGVPTLTCCCVGPCWSDEVDEITGKLSLL